jgi:two-component system NtrC family sensor kinase
MVGLLLLPEEVLASRRLDLGLVLTDTLFLVVLLYYAFGPDPLVFFTFFLVVLLSAISVQPGRTVALVTFAAGIHALFAWTEGVAVLSSPGFLMRLPFFFAAAIYYSYFTSHTASAQSQARKDRVERDHLRAILDVMESTTSSLDIHQVLYEVTSRMARQVGCARCSVMMIEADQATGMPRAFVLASSDNPMVDMLPIDLERYPEVRRAIETRGPVVLDNILEDDLMAEVRDQLRHLGFRSLMVIPMFHADRLVGSMMLRAAAERHFSPEQVYLAKVVASASANAVKNALLFRDTLRESQKHRETSEKLQRILDGSPDLIVTVDAEGEITEFSHGGTESLGYERREVVGRPLSTLFARHDQYQTFWNHCLHGNGSGEELVTLKARDESTREMSLRFSSFQGSPRQPVGVVAVGRDRTEEKRHEHQIQLAYRLSSMGDVIANVAHELNNPLSGVVGYSQLLMSRASTQPQDLRMLKQIHDSATRCHRTVQNLLSFGARHGSEKRFLGINGIIEKVVDLKSYRLQADGISVDLELQPDLPRTMVDFHQMEQVFLNLLQNAHLALMARSDGRRIVVRSRTEDGTIRVEVIDNGPGIEPDLVSKVFDPFFTTRRPEEGIGLGLSIAYGIIRDHGGNLQVSSSPGLGATFTVEMPVVGNAEEDADAEEVPRQAEKLPAPRHREGPRILVVDDEPAILDLFIDILERLPIRVDTAANGVEALRKVQECAYDLVISDMIMPEMDGPTLYREISRRRPEMLRRLVFTTGDSVGASSSEFLERVRRPVIPKPIDIRKVVEVVRSATGVNATA